ncbi:hypothetical protein CsSME_00011606 [Camellia sinensis var. sinensis]
MAATEVVEEEQGEMNSNNSSSNVMCQLTDPEGNPLGVAMYLPQSAGRKELQIMVNKLLNNLKQAMPNGADDMNSFPSLTANHDPSVDTNRAKISMMRSF